MRLESSLGVREKRLYMNVVSESEKVQILGEAAALKNFVSQLNTWSNNREFCDVQDEERDIFYWKLVKMRLEGS